MRKMIKAALALTLAAACSSGGSGVIVGFVINGQTGERMDFFKDDGAKKNTSDSPDATSQVYTLINGEFVRALPCGPGFINATNGVQADGCFKFTGVPYGEQLPIFATFDGFQTFHGIYEYPSPVVDDNGREHPTPQVVANIRLFPKNFTVAYNLMVNLNGRGINDVTVACQIRQESVKLATDGRFVAPLNTTSQAISATSGNDPVYGDGLARISGADLVLGAKYHCEAFRKGAYGTDGVLNGQLDFVAGVDNSELSLPVSDKATDGDMLYALFSNADDAKTLLGGTSSSTGVKAALIITFNRPVEIVPGSADCQVSRVNAPDTNGDQNPQTAPASVLDETGNGVSEEVKASLNGDGTVLTLTALLDPASNVYDPKDLGATVSFGGIFVRPKGSAGTVDGDIIRKIGPANGCAMSGISNAALKNQRTGDDQTITIHLY